MEAKRSGLASLKHGLDTNRFNERAVVIGTPYSKPASANEKVSVGETMT